MSGHEFPVTPGRVTDEWPRTCTKCGLREDQVAGQLSICDGSPLDWAIRAVRRMEDHSPLSLDDCAYLFAFEAVNAFINHPALRISHECREMLRRHLNDL